MEAVNTKIRAYAEMVSRIMGTRSMYNEKVFVGSHTFQGSYSDVQKLPSIPTYPAIDLETGEFYFMIDYDGVDGGNPIQ